MLKNVKPGIRAYNINTHPRIIYMTDILIIAITITTTTTTTTTTITISGISYCCIVFCIILLAYAICVLLSEFENKVITNQTVIFFLTSTVIKLN